MAITNPQPHPAAWIPIRKQMPDFRPNSGSQTDTVWALARGNVYQAVYDYYTDQWYKVPSNDPLFQVTRWQPLKAPDA